MILKIHGAVDRVDSEWGDSYVITEDHYIDYLTRTDIAGLLPVTLGAKLRRSHFLFLGYSMRDWNLRVILHRIWGQQKLNYKSWAIQVDPEAIEREFWQKRGVDILDVEARAVRCGARGRAPGAARRRDRSVSETVSEEYEPGPPDAHTPVGRKGSSCSSSVAIQGPDALRRGGRRILLRTRGRTARSSAPTSWRPA